MCGFKALLKFLETKPEFTPEVLYFILSVNGLSGPFFHDILQPVHGMVVKV